MPPTQPANPEPAHAGVDGMLARKFGKEVANYFSGSPLNRVAFLRTDFRFLSLALKHPSTRFLLCNNLQPLVQPAVRPGHGRLAYVPYDDVGAVIGDDPFAKSEQDIVEAFNSDIYVPQIIFLGIDEKDDHGLAYKSKNTHTGAPYFAVDVTPKHSLKDACETLIARLKDRGFEFGKGRMMDMAAEDAAIYAEARQLLDWNQRNPFCAACGQPTLSVNAGFKRSCPPTDRSHRMTRHLHNAVPVNPETPVETHLRPPCVTRTGTSNLCFPRTDPTVIMAVINSAGDKILLGRQRRWPPHWYSTLAGFTEPAESIEEAVRREVYEEAGILVGRVVIHSTQPWPYPANLMIGAVGQAIPTGETIDLGNDPELEDAKWFDFDTARTALKVGTSGMGEEAGPDYQEGDLRLPPSTAIANQLIAAVCNGFAGGVPKM